MMTRFRGMRAYKSKALQYDQYLIVIAGDVWLVTGDDKASLDGKYIGEYNSRLMYEGAFVYDATQIKPEDVPLPVVETAQLIAMECYAEDWRDFSPYQSKKLPSAATKP